MWYAEENFNELPMENRSLVVASANLLQKFDLNIGPAELSAMLTVDDPQVDFYSVAEYVDGIDIDKVSEDGWPESSKTIVKFRRMDVASAGFVDHYCLMADHRIRSIVDSLDGRIKLASVYGEPLAWAEYVVEAVGDELEEMEAIILAAAPVDKSLCVVAEGENFWDACRRINESADKMREYNEIDDPRDIKPGDVLHIPPHELKETKMIRYELLDTPAVMHVSNPNGTNKYSFGDATKWDHITPTSRHYRQGTNLSIAAIAHVELKDEGATAAYYMESIDVGNFPQTGRVQFTIGFNHSHLKEGQLIETRVEPKPEVKAILEEVAQAMPPKPTPVPAQDIAPPAPKPSIVRTEEWKKTQRPINAERKPILYVAMEGITVHDLEGKRHPKILSNSAGVLIYSTFEKDGVTYGRPIQSVENGNWFGIPMNKLMEEDALYNVDISLHDRVVGRAQLSGQERVVVALSKLLSQGVKIKTKFIKPKK